MKTQIIHGNGSGTILFLSGLHGNEYNPVVALFELFENEDSEYVSQIKQQYNKIVILHAVNTFGLKENTRLDEGGDDLNRINLESSNFDDFKSFVREADVVIDVHSSPKCESFLLINAGPLAESYIKFCNENSLNYVLWEQGSPNSVKGYALSLGKKAVTVECSTIGSTDLTVIEEVKDVIKTTSLAIGKFSFVESSIIPPCSFHVESPCSGILTWTSKTDCNILDVETLRATRVELPPTGNPLVWANAGFIKKSEFLALIQPVLPT